MAGIVQILPARQIHRDHRYHRVVAAVDPSRCQLTMTRTTLSFTLGCGIGGLSMWRRSSPPHYQL
jgi:hypothetical protein